MKNHQPNNLILHSLSSNNSPYKLYEEPSAYTTPPTQSRLGYQRRFLLFSAPQCSPIRQGGHQSARFMARYHSDVLISHLISQIQPHCRMVTQDCMPLFTMDIATWAVCVCIYMTLFDRRQNYEVMFYGVPFEHKPVANGRLGTIIVDQ